MYQIILIIIITVGTLLCTIGLMFSVKFQHQQKKKYKNCVNLIKEKENATMGVNDSLLSTNVESMDADKILFELYNIYLDFQNKLNELDKSVCDLLTGHMKDLYMSKVENMKEKSIMDIIENIDLLNYSIMENKEEQVKIRVNISCLSYKMKNNKIISGSNLEKISQINIITFDKFENSWLISNIEKVYEQKLGN